MQKLIVKYGTAAHLALLAVAPLILFPFAGESVIATTMLWLSVPAISWVVLAPSIHEGEPLHIARQRVALEMVRDPVLWLGLVLIAFTGFRALNTGVAIAYDAELAKWHVAEAQFPILPASAGSAGYLPFAAAVAAAVLLIGCRHSLGRSARMAFLLVAATLAGFAATIALVATALGNTVTGRLIACPKELCSFVGLAFALHFLGGMVALVAAFERKWHAAMALFVLAVGGTAAGAFAFAPARVLAVFGVAAAVLLVYSFLYSCRVLRSAGEFKALVVLAIALTLGTMLVLSLVPEETLQARADAFVEFCFLPDGFKELRELLSGIALKSWLTHLWIGTGIGSFPLDFRFGAAPEDWALVPRGASELMNGWWMLLAERGIVGAVTLALPYGFLLFTYGRNLVGGIIARRLPHPAVLLLPLVLAAIAVTGTYDCSFLRTDAIVVSVALLAISAKAFPVSKRNTDG